MVIEACIMVYIAVEAYTDIQNHFFKKKLEDISFFVGPLISLLWTSGYISRFPSQSGQPYLHLVEAYVLHIP